MKRHRRNRQAGRSDAKYLLLLGTAILWPLLMGIGPSKNCNDCDDCDGSSGQSGYEKATTRTTDDQVLIDGYRSHTKSGEERLVIWIKAESDGAPSECGLTWTPPVGATAISFDGLQPDVGHGPSYTFSNVPVRSSPPSTPDITISYRPPAGSEGRKLVDTFIVDLPDGPEGFGFPYRDGKMTGAGAPNLHSATVGEPAWKIQRWYFLSGQGSEIGAQAFQTATDLLTGGHGFVGIRIPIPWQGAFRIPVVMKNDENPILSLKDYRNGDDTVAKAPVVFVPEYQQFLEDVFPADDRSHWIALAVEEGAEIPLPDDLPIPAGFGQIYAEGLLDLAHYDECDGCELEAVLCVENETIPAALRMAAPFLGGAKTYQDSRFTCLGPYQQVLSTGSFKIIGSPLTRVAPGTRAQFMLEFVSSSSTTATFEIQSDRDRSWQAYAGDFNGPNLSQPLNGAFSFDSFAPVWLLADISAGDSGFESVLVTGRQTGSQQPDVKATSVLLIGDFTFPAPDRSTWIPVGVHAPGANASQWRTDLGILNPDSEAAAVDITVHASDGDHSLSTVVEAGAQVILADVLQQIPFNGAGSMEIQTDTACIVTSRTFTEIAGDAQCLPGGTLGQFLDSSDNTTVLSAGQTGLIPQLVENGAYRTNIALTNTGSIQAVANVRLFDAAGTEIGSQELTLAPGKWFQINQAFADFAAVDVPAGYAVVEVTEGTGIIGYGSVIDNITNDPTTMPLVPSNAGSTNPWIAVAVRASGANNSQWRTDLGLLNPNPQEATAVLTLHAGDGDHSMTVTVMAGGQTILTDVVGMIPFNGAGSLEIASDQPLIATSRTYTEIAETADCFPGGTLGQFLDSSATITVLGAGEQARIGQLVETETYRTNIALTNTGSIQAVANIRLFDSAGTEVGSKELTLIPGKWFQINQAFADVGAIDVPAGYAVIEVTEGAGVIGYGSVVDNITNDPTTLPLIQ